MDLHSDLLTTEIYHPYLVADLSYESWIFANIYQYYVNDRLGPSAIQSFIRQDLFMIPEIPFASLLAIYTEIALNDYENWRGKRLCRGVRTYLGRNHVDTVQD